jgi:hypothetical protein
MEVWLELGLRLQSRHRAAVKRSLRSGVRSLAKIQSRVSELNGKLSMRSAAEPAPCLGIKLIERLPVSYSRHAR